MLLDEYDAWEASLEKECDRALRVNTAKAGKDFLNAVPFRLTCVPWAKNCYYYEKADAPGKHPYHEAGLYYIQEPSAMAVAEYLEVKPQERILDLCAAPGGKSAQIAAKMDGSGVLVCNEIHPLRAKILSENIERMGICNAIVTNEPPEKLAEAFEGYFDKILVDAPCSGEGMFRKNEDAVLEWSLENVKLCAKRQEEILSCAARMLRPGGRLVYSTCTFAPEENEGSVSRFLQRQPEFEILPAAKKAGMTAGRSDWIQHPAPHMEYAVRLFPHKLRGEGHFLAVLRKREDACGVSARKEESGMPEKNFPDWLEFARENLTERPSGVCFPFGEQLYLLFGQAPLLRGIKVLRPGLHLGTNKKRRFEPSHALALYLKKDAVCRSLDLPSDGKEIFSYLNGEAIFSDGEKGWHLMTTDGYGVGWGKRSGGMMKNHYPKGLRKKLSPL